MSAESKHSSGFNADPRFNFSGLPIGEINYLRKLVDLYNGTNLEVGTFFSMALLPYYDAMWDGLDSITGDVIYRLSDGVLPEVRASINIYPSKEGSLLIDVGDGEYERWASLNDWRGTWKEMRGEIPDFQKQNQKMLPARHEPRRRKRKKR